MEYNPPLAPASKPPLVVRPIRRGEQAHWCQLMRQHHYLGFERIVGESLCYVASQASDCQDRRFMARYMPRLEAWFHYRNLDVSTLKELCKRWKPELAKGLTKHGKHEALADIYESIEEMKYYREHFLKV